MLLSSAKIRHTPPYIAMVVFEHVDTSKLIFIGVILFYELVESGSHTFVCLEDDLEHLEPPHPIYEVLRIEPRTFCL